MIRRWRSRCRPAGRGRSGWRRWCRAARTSRCRGLMPISGIRTMKIHQPDLSRSWHPAHRDGDAGDQQAQRPENRQRRHAEDRRVDHVQDDGADEVEQHEPPQFGSLRAPGEGGVFLKAGADGCREIHGRNPFSVRTRALAGIWHCPECRGRCLRHGPPRNGKWASVRNTPNAAGLFAVNRGFLPIRGSVPAAGG